MYVRQSELPPVDHIMIEKLQREVAQLRTFVLKFKEAASHGPQGLLNDYLTRQKLTTMDVKEVLDRKEVLEEELRRERNEVSLR